MDNPYFVLKTNEAPCRYVGLEAPGEGPKGGHEFLSSHSHPRTIKFASHQNAQFYATWSGALPWVKDQYAAGFLSVDMVKP